MVSFMSVCLSETGEMELMAFYRFRMKNGAEDLAGPVWKTGHVGIWFGAWKPEEYEKLRKCPRDEQLRQLDRINQAGGVEWRDQQGKAGFTTRRLDTIERFYNLKSEDWVCACFEGRIHMGHVVCHAVERGDQFDRSNELFKWRQISGIKSFELLKLPDPYKLVPSGGLGTLFQMRSYESMMQILAESKSEQDVVNYVDQLKWSEWLKFLGPRGWESLCLGFLVLEHHFVPTGLLTGSTLKDVDIVGADFATGQKIYAQCKNDRDRWNEPPAEFLRAVEPSLLEGHDGVFLFAYGGCKDCPTGMTLITGEDIQKWFEESPAGIRYRRLIDGKPPSGNLY
jgi:hypothetical protein